MVFCEIARINYVGVGTGLFYLSQIYDIKYEPGLCLPGKGSALHNASDMVF